MYKAICIKDNCDNKDVVYYIPEVEKQTMCGGCKKFITPTKMTQEEYDSVFDYDPFAKFESI